MLDNIFSYLRHVSLPLHWHFVQTLYIMQLDYLYIFCLSLVLYVAFDQPVQFRPSRLCSMLPLTLQYYFFRVHSQSVPEIVKFPDKYSEFSSVSLQQKADCLQVMASLLPLHMLQATFKFPEFFETGKTENSQEICIFSRTENVN